MTASKIHIACETDTDHGKHEIEAQKVAYPKDRVKIACLPQRKELTVENLSQIAIKQKQTVGNFVRRIGANLSSQKSGNGEGSDLRGRRDINVFVVDTGVDYHADLNLQGGVDFTGSRTGFTDDNGHGTHVAGIIGAFDNNLGIVGVAPGVRLWSVRVLDARGSGTLAGVIAGLDWILKNRGSGHAIVNMSLGGGVSPQLDAAVERLVAAGIIVCVAAGNENQNAYYSSPARAASAITVGATGSTATPNYNDLAPYSNYGTIVDILAPGTSINSTYLNGKYATLSGTSMATPVVAGTIALMLSKRNYPGYGTASFVAAVRSALIAAATPVKPSYHNGGTGTNVKILIPLTKYGTTNNSVWAGIF